MGLTTPLLESETLMDNIRVERSKEFVDRLKNGGVRGNECVTAFFGAHKAKKMIDTGNYALTYHILDQCQERGIDTDLDTTLKSNPFLITSVVGERDKVNLALKSEEANLVIIAKIDLDTLVLVTAYNLVEPLKYPTMIIPVKRVFNYKEALELPFYF